MSNSNSHLLTLGGVCFCAWTANVTSTTAESSATQRTPTSRAGTSNISIDEIKVLLSVKNHLPIPFSASDSSVENPQEHKLFLRQTAAINRVGAKQLVEFIPNLIAYMDYPADPSVNPFVTPQQEVHEYEVRKSWPALAAILQIGDAAIAPVEKFILDSKQDLRLRLTAFQVLQLLYKYSRGDQATGDEQLRKTAQSLLQEAEKAGQKGAINRINLVLSNRLPFWGMMEFTPIRMSVKEVTDLLASQRHIQDIRVVLLKEQVKNLPGAAANDRHADYTLFLRQKEAIYTAGELGLESLVPNLVLFTDYPNNVRDLQLLSLLSSQPQSQRRRFPALDAILKIGNAAVPSLEKIIQDRGQEVRLRLSALSALREIDFTRAETTGTSLIQELEAANNQRGADRAKFILRKERRTSESVSSDVSIPTPKPGR